MVWSQLGKLGFAPILLPYNRTTSRTPLINVPDHLAFLRVLRALRGASLLLIEYKKKGQPIAQLPL